MLTRYSFFLSQNDYSLNVQWLEGIQPELNTEDHYNENRDRCVERGKRLEETLHLRPEKYI